MQRVFFLPVRFLISDRVCAVRLCIPATYSVASSAFLKQPRCWKSVLEEEVSLIRIINASCFRRVWLWPDTKVASRGVQYLSIETQTSPKSVSYPHTLSMLDPSFTLNASICDSRSLKLWSIIHNPTESGCVAVWEKRTGYRYGRIKCI